jgi:hypothetical protein
VAFSSIHDDMRLFACATPFRSISRQGWLHATSQCRSFHLLKATFPGDVSPLAPSRRKILDFGPANYKKASKTHIHLRTHKDGKVHEMSLETALLKFAKPGKLLLPFPQPKMHKADDRLLHSFRPIDITRIQHQLSRRPWSHEYHFSPIRADDGGLFENYMAAMAEIWLLLLIGNGNCIEIQVYAKGSKDRNAFQKMLNQNIYLRPDVILAAMPQPSRIIIEPYTNYEKVCWVMKGPILRPWDFGIVKPLSEMETFHQRKLEVMKAVRDKYGAGVQVREEDHAHTPSELKDEGMQNMDRNTTNLPASLKSSREGGEVQAKMLPESLGSFPVPPALSTLSLEEQEMEDYRKLEEITGFRPPEP